MTSPRSLLLLAALGLGLPATSTLGCAKKGDPSAEEVPFEVALGAVELIRRDTGVAEEQDQLRFPLKITNGLKGPVTVSRVEYSFSIGERELGTATHDSGAVVQVGQTQDVVLIGRFEWRQTSDMPTGKAGVKGTVYWVGPHDIARTTTFNLSKDYAEAK